MGLEKWGPYLFLAGIVIALLIGVAQFTDPILYALLVLLGLVVGVVNVQDKEVVAFLVAAIALMGSATALQQLSLVVGADAMVMVNGVISAILVFVAPAAFVVALKAIYDLAGEGGVSKVMSKLK